MTVALRSSGLVGALIPVDNAPVDAVLNSDFGKALEGMREIESAGIKKQVEADQILSKYEGVRLRSNKDSQSGIRLTPGNIGTESGNPAIPDDEPCKSPRQ